MTNQADLQRKLNIEKKPLTKPCQHMTILEVLSIIAINL